MGLIWAGSKQLLVSIQRNRVEKLNFDWQEIVAKEETKREMADKGDKPLQRWEHLAATVHADFVDSVIHCRSEIRAYCNI
ncbi:hypothetical protein L596_026970 [Steinernema carpocapsae]|uniref:Uncharacterized protein n=1 Tax=Steinernema carpocapsae TaxID=34508 RepID=A0A4V5ZYB7_STECR|nr:hypothetical protein L596_026970 [Steinernema carpocapsae]